MWEKEKKKERMGTSYDKFSSSKKSHAVCIPTPAQSHIGAMLKLAKLLHYKGFYISFVNNEFNQKRLFKARGPNFLDNLPNDFQFLTIPDGLPDSDEDAIQDLLSLGESIRTYMAAPISQLIADINNNTNTTNGATPGVTCIVSDGFMSLSTSTVAEELEIPLVNLWTIPACAIMALRQYRSLQDKGFTPLKDDVNMEKGFLDTVIDSLPGMKNMRIRDLPLFHPIDDANGTFMHFVLDSVERNNHKVTAAVIHTYDALETDVLAALSSMFSSPVYAIGPFHHLLDEISQEENHLKHLGCNLLKEDTKCLEWLNTREPKSVLYLNFGSIAFLTSEQLAEFAMGICNSELAFLWVIRPDLVKGENAILPAEFIKETKGRGFFSGWCPQEEVLKHPSIGGFLTHCGWNSIIESISAGVPMLCWPFFGDQQTISRNACAEWGVGVEICNNFKREELEKLARDVVEGEKGKEMRLKAMEWNKLAREATSPYGSSSKNLEMLVGQLLAKELA